MLLNFKSHLKTKICFTISHVFPHIGLLPNVTVISREVLFSYTFNLGYIDAFLHHCLLAVACVTPAGQFYSIILAVKWSLSRIIIAGRVLS
jgi:hypothetical protein